MDRRDFLRRGGSGVAALLATRCASDRGAGGRLRIGSDVSAVIRAAAEDAAQLLTRASGQTVVVSSSLEPPRPSDITVGTERSLSGWGTGPAGAGPPGSFRIASSEGRGVAVVGQDEEGARNGLYALLRQLGFAFFRDGETLPALSATARWIDAAVEMAASPAFRWRGDMIWDNYLGPSRFCASVWGDRQWERALLFMARSGMNFLEYYPPLETVLARAFPEADGLDQGPLYQADAKHALAQRVLARGRELGIRFMYVLTYGSFPQPIRELYRDLEWRNGFLCAHQPELMELTERCWRALVQAFGTDHCYAIRHRGEEEQSYSDPCRSVTKSQGFVQALEVLQRIDPDAEPTVWTWGERLPELFEQLPQVVRAVHVRHGMADVFGERGEGREQSDGRPEIADGRRWLSAQFTVFGGNETLIQTGWSDAAALAADARASQGDPDCDGYFQWPEWSDTAPWLSHVIARLSWDPAGFGPVASELEAYARERHGPLAPRFLDAFVPVIEEKNARFMYPPRKRLLAPFFASEASLAVLRRARDGAMRMAESLDTHAMLQRDFVDIITWIALRSCTALEASAYRAHHRGRHDDVRDGVARARSTWSALEALLGLVPELSIVASARSAARRGLAISSRAEDSFWELGCDFYNGYPLVLSPEAVELVYLPQLERLAALMGDASSRGDVFHLEEPGWFWHDFPERGWADAVRRLPSEDAEKFESTMRTRLRDALVSEEMSGATDGARVTPSEPSSLDVERAAELARQIATVDLPSPLSLEAWTPV